MLWSLQEISWGFQRKKSMICWREQISCHSPIAVATPHILISGFRHLNGESCRLRFFTSMFLRFFLHKSKTVKVNDCSHVTWCFLSSAFPFFMKLQPSRITACLRTHKLRQHGTSTHSCLETKCLVVNEKMQWCSKRTFSIIDVKINLVNQLVPSRILPNKDK